MILLTRGGSFFGRIAWALLLVMPAAVMGDDAYQKSSEYSGLAVAIDRALPASPRHRPRRLQEAWVRMSYVVTADGRAIDPIIINSSGGIQFENEVRKVSESWRFEPSATGAELPLNVTDTRFSIRGRGKGTTRRFARFARHIMYDLHAGDVAAARKQADIALNMGGWNLYESTILWLMVGRIEGAEGNDVGKLEMYRRGLATSDERSLRRNARIDLLEDIFELESEFGQYSAAMQTMATLKAIRGSQEAVARLSARSREITNLLASDPTLVASATVVNPCDCDAGVALWDYVPTRRIFSFDNLNGNVDRFEARCERQRISGTIQTGRRWTLATDWGFCHIYVFGDDGATFDFIEHLPNDGHHGTAAQTTVARNHVLDQRNRSQ